MFDLRFLAPLSRAQPHGRRPFDNVIVGFKTITTPLKPTTCITTLDAASKMPQSSRLRSSRVAPVLFAPESPEPLTRAASASTLTSRRSGCTENFNSSAPPWPEARWERSLGAEGYASMRRGRTMPSTPPSSSTNVRSARSATPSPNPQRPASASQAREYLGDQSPHGGRQMAGTPSCPNEDLKRTNIELQRCVHELPVHAHCIASDQSFLSFLTCASPRLALRAHAVAALTQSSIICESSWRACEGARKR